VLEKFAEEGLDMHTLDFLGGVAKDDTVALEVYRGFVWR
jgi:hypothetical protein